MSKIVVIDASLAAMWAVPEVHSNQALALANQWAQEDTHLVAVDLVHNHRHSRVVEIFAEFASDLFL